MGRRKKGSTATHQPENASKELTKKEQRYQAIREENDRKRQEEARAEAERAEHAPKRRARFFEGKIVLEMGDGGSHNW